MHPPTASTTQVTSVNVGQAAPLHIGGRNFLSGIAKSPVRGPVAVNRLGLQGDEQADLSVHGGLDKAVYAYPTTHGAFWREQRQLHGLDGERAPHPTGLPPGFMGENLCITGLLETEAWVGDELHFPDCVLRITAPRQPCFKFDSVMGFPRASRLMAQHAFCGFYLAVDRTGSIAAGQTFTVVPGTRGLRIADAMAALRAKHLR